MLRKNTTWFLEVALLLLLLLLSIGVSLSVGEFSIPLKNIPTVLSDKESVEYGVLSYIRIPRTLLGFAIGGSLSLAGAIFD